MTDCPNAEMRDRLPDLAGDTLAPADRSLVLAHVAACAACAAELELLGLVRSVVRAATPAVDVAGIVAALPRADRVPVRTWGARTAASWRIAAAVTVLAAGAGSYAVMQGRMSPPISPDSIAVEADVAESSNGLALTGRLADLNDAELAALVDGLGKIEALPATEVESDLTVSGAAGAGVPDSVLRDLEGI